MFKLEGKARMGKELEGNRGVWFRKKKDVVTKEREAKSGKGRGWAKEGEEQKPSKRGKVVCPDVI